MSWFKKTKKATDMTKVIQKMTCLKFAVNGLGDAAKTAQESVKTLHKAALRHRRGVKK